MTLRDLQSTFRSELKSLYPDEEINSLFYILTEHYLKINRLQASIDRDMTLDKTQFGQLLNAFNRIKNGEPVQYIIGEVEFNGLNLIVNESVLVPRPETEELVHWVIDHYKESSFKPKYVVDIGTGSGCIALSMAKAFPEALVYALDKSAMALEVANKNAKRNGLEIHLQHVDILSRDFNWSETSKLDLIISNPPYVRQQEKSKMSKNVLDYEPHQALFVSDSDPLIFYKVITKFAVDNLSDNGLLYFEFNEYLGEEMERLLDDNRFETEIKSDLFGKERMLRAKRKK